MKLENNNTTTPFVENSKPDVNNDSLQNNNQTKIGNQVWFAVNLDVSTFRNGDDIFEAKSENEWEKAGKEGKAAWCYYDNDCANGKNYGRLYNWFAIQDVRGLIPEGWHIPSDKEWMVLIDHLGEDDLTHIKLKATTGWKGSGCGTNESGFDGLPGGIRSPQGLFRGIGKVGEWWSTTESCDTNAWCMALGYDYSEIERTAYLKTCGISVRCIQD